MQRLFSRTHVFPILLGFVLVSSSAFAQYPPTWFRILPARQSIRIPC